MRRRISFLMIMASLLPITLFAVPLSFVAAGYFHARAETELDRIGYAVAAASADNLLSGSQVTLAQHNDGLSIGLYDSDLHLVSGSGYPGAGRLVSQALAGTKASASIDGHMMLAVPVIERDVVKGAVLASRPLAQIQQTVLLSWTGLAALTLAALVVSFLLGRHQAARLARPIEELSRTARRLGEGDFDTRATSVGLPEIDSLNHTLQQASHRLRELIERERALSRDASHQIRTPLTALRLQLEQAATAPRAERQNLQPALETIDRLEATVTDMLQLVRGTPSVVDPFNVSDLFEHARQRWDSTYGAGGRALRTEVTGELPLVRFPANAGRQIINVLIDNAGTHGSGVVTVAARDSLGSLAIDVTQEGRPLDVPVRSTKSR
jgi:signal transduction histidine kinase